MYIGEYIHNYMFKFGKRSIINLNKSRVVTIPKGWINQLDEIPQEVYIIMDDDKNLKICPVKK